MKRHAESHLDHGLNEAQVAYIFDLFKDQREFFKTVIELPVELGTVPCGLWGPVMGDLAIVEGREVLPLPPGDYILPADAGMWSGRGLDFTGAITMAKRGARGWDSRLIDMPCRPTRKVFIVAGPHEEHACILYTCYGGSEAPQEPTDPNLPDNKRAVSEAFWKVHALSRYAI